MNVTLDDGVVATLHKDRAGLEWVTITSDLHPDYEGELTPEDDPPLFLMFKEMILRANE